MTYKGFEALSRWLKDFARRNNVTVVVPAKAPPPVDFPAPNPDTVIIDYVGIMDRPEEK